VPTTRITIVAGPDKAELTRAAASNGSLHITFVEPDGERVETQISAIETIGASGVDFTVWGQLASSPLRGAVFTGVYNCEAREGRLALKISAR
jgi:hypothetical protein